MCPYPSLTAWIQCYALMSIRFTNLVKSDQEKMASNDLHREAVVLPRNVD